MDNVLSRVPGFPASALLLSDANSAADSILSEALDFCVRETALDSRRAAVERLRQGDRITRSLCHYCLAERVAEHLGSCDNSIRAVYIYDHDVAVEDELDPRVEGLQVHLIIWAEPWTAALSSLVAALDQALAKGLGDLTEDEPLPHLLDVQLIDDDDVERRAGNAALFSSTHHQPVQVWKRERRIAMSYPASAIKPITRPFDVAVEIERSDLKLLALRALKRERQALTDKIRQQELLLAEEDPLTGNDPGDSANRMSGQSKSIAMRRLWGKMLQEVRRAIDRIEQGTYGVCEHCGHPISEGRLRAMPSAALCIECARLQVRNVRAV